MSWNEYKPWSQDAAQLLQLSCCAGTYQEYCVVDEEVLEAVPDEVSDEAAASFWINPVRQEACDRNHESLSWTHMIDFLASSAWQIGEETWVAAICCHCVELWSIKA